jgi:hypothetical protein
VLVNLPYNFEPRAYQSDLLRAVFIDKLKHIYWIVHRRAGKTRTAINVLTIAALQAPGLYLYLMPQSNQVRKVVWKGRGSDGVRFLDQVPHQLIKKSNNVEMTVELLNGSIMMFAGSNNYDSLMGINPLMIMYDEFPLQNPLAYELLSPILLENGGTEVIFGTPRGHNHGYDVYNVAVNNPNWYVKRLTIDDTMKVDGSPIITSEHIEEERRNGKSEEIIQQEYYCSFDIGNQGAYYTNEISVAEYEGRIRDFDINPNLPVHTSWDIGIRDSTSICFFQQVKDQIHYIAYIEGNNKGLQEYWKEVQDMKTALGFHKFGYHFAPHDIRNREWASSARSRLAMAAELGLHFLVVPDLSIQDRIDAGRAFLRDCVFHKTYCRQLLRCLREAMREYDELHKVFKDKPLHNWALHGFDAYTYGAVAWRHQFADPQMNEVRRYQRDLE